MHRHHSVFSPFSIKAGWRITVPFDLHYVLSPNASREDKFRLFCRRVAALAALAIFVCIYMQSILAFGLLVGLVIGWLPAATIAWLGANVLQGATAAMSLDG